MITFAIPSVLRLQIHFKRAFYLNHVLFSGIPPLLPRDAAFVRLSTGVTHGMYCATLAALRGVLLCHRGVEIRLQPRWSSSREAHRVQIQTPTPPFRPQTWHPFLRAPPPHHPYAGFLTAIFVPAAAASPAHSSGAAGH